MGLKKQRLFNGGEGKQKKSVRFPVEKGARQGHHQRQINENYISKRVERQQIKEDSNMRQGQQKQKSGKTGKQSACPRRKIGR